MSHRDSVRDFLFDNHERRHLEETHSFISSVHIIPDKKEMEGDDDYWSEYEWDDEDDAEDEDGDEEGDDPTRSDWVEHDP